MIVGSKAPGKEEGLLYSRRLTLEKTVHFYIEIAPNAKDYLTYKAYKFDLTNREKIR